MGGSSKGGGARQETQATIYPSPAVNPVAQPDPGAQTNFSQYYIPQSIEALRQQMLTNPGAMPFGIRSNFRQVAPDSPYAAPRAPQIFRPMANAPVVPMSNPMEDIYAARLAELEARMNASRYDYGTHVGGNDGGDGEGSGSTDD